MNDALKLIELDLRDAMKLTHQGSYHRRAPSKEAVPLLEGIRQRLGLWIERHGETADALRMLALANEALLNYGPAIEMLEKAIKLSPEADQKDLKRLVNYREAHQMFNQIKLSADELGVLGNYLRRKLLDTAPEKSLRWTENWLNENKPEAKPSIIISLQEMGYSCDYSILHNLVPG